MMIVERRSNIMMALSLETIALLPEDTEETAEGTSPGLALRKSLKPSGTVQ